MLQAADLIEPIFGGVTIILDSPASDAAPALVAKLADHIAADGLGPDDLPFCQPRADVPARRTLPEVLPDLNS